MFETINMTLFVGRAVAVLGEIVHCFIIEFIQGLLSLASRLTHFMHLGAHKTTVRPSEHHEKPIWDSVGLGSDMLVMTIVRSGVYEQNQCE